jgi:hypothetical protein
MAWSSTRLSQRPLTNRRIMSIEDSRYPAQLRRRSHNTQSELKKICWERPFVAPAAANVRGWLKPIGEIWPKADSPV